MLTRVTAPAELPVTVAELKEDLRIRHSEQDAALERHIQAATTYVDGYHGVFRRALVSQQWKQTFSRLNSPLRIELDPLISVEAVKYLDLDNVEQTLPTEDYYVARDALGGYIKPTYGSRWPVTYEHDEAVTVEFTAGYGDAAAVPADVKGAILLLAGHLFEARKGTSEETVREIALGVDDILFAKRRHI